MKALAVGNGLWLDKGQQQCLILWHKLDAWAQIIYEWARNSGLQDSVMTIDELSSGDEVQGTGKSRSPFRVPTSNVHLPHQIILSSTKHLLVFCQGPCVS